MARAYCTVAHQNELCVTVMCAIEELGENLAKSEGFRKEKVLVTF